MSVKFKSLVKTIRISNNDKKNRQDLLYCIDDLTIQLKACVKVESKFNQNSTGRLLIQLKQCFLSP